ncbi:hypothetical protein B0H14DRAFT_2340616 [Mycena olivaceomarginata]|nr:hypothetical protein B0H14DRAFT_2340616 [Mycena olivaceomarginata]
MLLLLLVYYIGQATFVGSRPIDSDNTFPPSIAARASRSSCPDAENCRTTWNIVQSCLATIFSCTWVAVHPNIPRPKMSLVQRLRHSFWEFLSNRMLLFVIALLVPEYILAWAIWQRLRAQKIAQKHKDSNWTVTHGFFVIMGGFHLFEPLSRTPEETRQQLQQASVADQPNPTKIKDRGKSDSLAKSIVLIHTTWFLTQCIARGIQRLAITELEIVTGAYAMMNFVIYFFWWKKPLNIGCPVRVIDTNRQGETPTTDRKLGGIQGRRPWNMHFMSY